MILNLGSLAFNANIETGGGTPAWGTELGQGEGYKFMFEDMSDFFTGMVYSSVADIENVTCPLGKGGNARNDFEFVIASHFKKIYVNNQNVPNAQFILLVIKELVGDHHVGRRTIKYNPRMTYRGEEINDDCFKKIANALGLNNDSAWFIHEINILNQDELHFTAYELGEQTITYSSTEERKNAFLSKLPKDGKKICVGESILQKKPLQQIYYGAPGTGKSHTINKITEAQPKENVFRTTFHPDSDYSTFVGAYKPTKLKSSGKATQPILDYDSLVDKFKEYLSVPNANITIVCTQFGFDYHDSIVRIQERGQKVMDLVNDAYKSNTSYDSVVRGGMACYEQVASKDKDAGITYEFVPQSFTKAYIRAWQTEDPVYLVIEEINRGNCAQIFGDLFQLLDRGNNGYSEYPIKADNDLGMYLAKELSSSGRTDIPVNVKNGDELVLPSNLYIWATMNTSDQSLFPIDSAFKRRWNWVYIPIDTHKERWYIQIGDKQYSWTDFLNKANDELLTDETAEDKHLGFYFCKPSVKRNESDPEPTIITQESFVSKVLFYLWTDVFKVYGIPSSIGNNKDWSFAKFYASNGSVNVEKVKELMEKLNIADFDGKDAVDTEIKENSVDA